MRWISSQATAITSGTRRYEACPARVARYTCPVVAARSAVRAVDDALSARWAGMALLCGTSHDGNPMDLTGVPPTDPRNITIPRHVWEAAARLVLLFNTITAQEKVDQTTVLEEWQRRSQVGRD